MAEPYPSQSADRLMLRLPDGMRAEIKSRAALARRTMNSEALVLLEAGLKVVYGAHRASKESATNG